MITALTLGNFDGVHRGHRALVEAVVEWKRTHQQSHPNTRTMVMSFEPHPVEVLRPGTIVPRLTPTREKIHLLQSLGIDEVRIVPFTTDFSKMSARDFFEQVLVKDLHLGFLAIGHNFYFGHNREGTPGKIVDWCAAQRGQLTSAAQTSQLTSAAQTIEARLVDPVEADGAPISSSRIRKLIQEGQMIAASRLLGRDYSISGEVVHGDKRGRLLGFPTANIVPPTEVIGAPCLPAKGVYLTFSTVEGKTFPSVTNVGIKPTVQAAGPLVIETHVLDFTGDLYGKQLTVEFRDRVRPEMKFSGLDQLKEQIQKDTQTARARLRDG